jgi:hypothetical protein
MKDLIIKNIDIQITFILSRLKDINFSKNKHSFVNNNILLK